MTTAQPLPTTSPEDAITDHIERDLTLRAPRDRVWRALADPAEFGTWFGVDLAGQTFQAGRRSRGRMTACGHENVWFDVLVERVEPTAAFAFRWHPFAMDSSVDLSHEPPTLVTFTLEDTDAGGTRLTVVESGFDHVPPERRFLAYRMNSQGWTAQVRNLARHVGDPAH